MIENPYKPLTEAEATPFAFHEAYRSTRTLSMFLVALLMLSAALELVVGIVDVVGYAIVPGWAGGDFQMQGSALTIFILILVFGVGAVLVFVLCAILFLIWVHQSTANAHTLGARDMTSPNWAVVHWLIPIWNLFRPYQVARDVYRFSAENGSPSGTLLGDLPAYFGVWWCCWIVSSILGWIEFRAEINGWDLGVAALPLSVSSTIISIAAAVFAAIVIRQTSKIQDEHHRSMYGLGPES